MLKDGAHSQKAADAAVGLGTDNGRLQQVEAMEVRQHGEAIT
jgi:2-methylcitrate dehydratase PrpD